MQTGGAIPIGMHPRPGVRAQLAIGSTDRQLGGCATLPDPKWRGRSRMRADKTKTDDVGFYDESDFRMDCPDRRRMAASRNLTDPRRRIVMTHKAARPSFK